MIVEVTNHQVAHAVDSQRLRQAVEAVLSGEGIADAEVSVAVVDDHTIHELNRRCLQHDYPTDVLSFVLERDENRLEGEVIVSADTAASEAGKRGIELADELMLYVVHGVLHLAGYDDQKAGDQRAMRDKERQYLLLLGVEMPPPEN